jgi:PAS domain S-box-containing protein
MIPLGTTRLSEKPVEEQTIKVLIVEDEKLQRLNCRAILEDMGHHVIEAADGAEGLEIFKRELPDLVLTDLRMPVMDGLSLILKLHEIAPDTPVIVISGVGNLDEAVASLRFGAWDYLAKPIVHSDMGNMVNKVLEKARNRKEKREYREHLEELVRERTERLSDATRKWEQTFDALPDLIAILDPDFRMTRVNKAMADRLGIPAKGCRGKICFEVVHGTSTPPAFCPHQKTLKDGGVHTEVVTEKGLGGVFSVCTSPIFDPEGRLIGSVHVARDVTEYKKLEAQFRQAQKMEAVGRLAGAVAHDFNNLLNIIMGRAELALNGMDPDSPVCRDLREIIATARRSADLTRQLLAFSRKQPIAPKVLDLNKAIGELLKMLHRLIGKNIRLSWSPEDNVWPVKMDSSQFDQILANLCVNARDAIGTTGRITIETTNVSADDTYCTSRPGLRPGDYVLLTVSDDGCGIDKEALGEIFEPFFTTKEEGKGTGLGLATVYGIVKQNNGHIEVTSEIGIGTTFRIFLPRHSDDS